MSPVILQHDIYIVRYDFLSNNNEVLKTKLDCNFMKICFGFTISVFPDFSQMFLVK